MDKYNLSVRKGATLINTWTNDEEGALTAALTISQNGEEVVDPIVGEFEGLVADLTIPADVTDSLDIGVYDYMVTLVYEDGTVEKYPDVDKCEDCTLPTLTICTANDTEDEEGS